MEFQFSGISEAADEIREFIILNKDALPEHIRDRLINLTRTGTSPVDMVTGFVRAVWANRDTLPARPKRIAIAAAELAQANGWHGQIEGRAAGISAALRRDLQDDPPAGVTWPAKEDDPDADDALLPPPAPVEATPGAIDG